jgi:hypothetical protein
VTAVRGALEVHSIVPGFPRSSALRRYHQSGRSSRASSQPPESRGRRDRRARGGCEEVLDVREALLEVVIGDAGAALDRIGVGDELA